MSKAEEQSYIDIYDELDKTVTGLHGELLEMRNSGGGQADLDRAVELAELALEQSHALDQELSDKRDQERQKQ